MRRLTPSGLSVAKRAAARVLAEVTFVEARPELVALAADLTERHSLRAYDAVHLASVLELRDPDVVIATWDEDLRAAAQGEGFTIAT